MPGWVTKVTYKPAFQAEYNPILPQLARERVIHFPYLLIGGIPTVDSWVSVKSEIDSEGSAERWCQLDIANPDLAIPGAIWYVGEIPAIPSDIPDPPVIDAQYKDDLLSAGIIFLNLLKNPEWNVFVERFRLLTGDQIENTPIFKAARDISAYIGELWK